MSARCAPHEALPALVAFQQYARFESIDRTANRERFYLLAVQPNLFGDISLVWTWGRIGTNDNSRTSTVPDREHAQLLVERLIRRRIRRRYELVAWT